MNQNDIFAKEERIITDAEKKLASEQFSTAADAGEYKELLEEYRRLLKQMRSVVKMSDITQGKLNTMSMELERLSNMDELTDLNNRRCFNERFAKEWFFGCITESPLGILMIDIDYFKQYNDTYGHLQGDKCLRKIAEIIKNTVNRPGDFTARFGGEEFIVLLPNTDLSGCAYISEKILHNIEAYNQDDSEELLGTVTVSIGTNSMVPDERINMEALIRGADSALYRAKEDGRNCCRSAWM